MKILVFGAGGIIGQHMMLSKPDGVEALFYRRKADRLFTGMDNYLEIFEADAVVNLAGESNPDAVEKDPSAHKGMNVEFPAAIAGFCDGGRTHYVHVSSQIVLDPVNEYGRQKAAADRIVSQGKNWTIAMPTFVLGVRPFPGIGRLNPVEQMLGGQTLQVYDRWFSPSFARDVARQLWKIAQGPPQRTVVQLGVPTITNRYEIACKAGVQAVPASHDSFKGLAPRPIDTTFGQEALFEEHLSDGLARCRAEWESQQRGTTIQRSRELALFLGITEEKAFTRLNRGFGIAHGEVKDDFRRANPKTDEALLEWYRTTEAYLWELSAYHADERFNYAGMCRGIAERLKAEGSRWVLCLGDGIGTLTLALQQAGLNAVYHDLAGSRTAKFAAFRYWAHMGGELPQHNSSDWTPPKAPGLYDAVTALDFLEHVTDVPAWATAIRGLLRPGGLLCSQNAFACGSGPQGSIPCHLERNDRFEKDWDPLLASLGFVQESSNWYRVPATEESQQAA